MYIHYDIRIYWKNKSEFYKNIMKEFINITILE